MEDGPGNKDQPAWVKSNSGWPLKKFAFTFNAESNASNEADNSRNQSALQGCECSQCPVLKEFVDGGQNMARNLSESCARNPNEIAPTAPPATFIFDKSALRNANTQNPSQIQDYDERSVLEKASQPFQRSLTILRQSGKTSQSKEGHVSDNTLNNLDSLPSLPPPPPPLPPTFRSIANTVISLQQAIRTMKEDPQDADLSDNEDTSFQEAIRTLKDKIENKRRIENLPRPPHHTEPSFSLKNLLKDEHLESILDRIDGIPPCDEFDLDQSLSSHPLPPPPAPPPPPPLPCFRSVVARIMKQNQEKILQQVKKKFFAGRDITNPTKSGDDSKTSPIAIQDSFRQARVASEEKVVNKVWPTGPFDSAANAQPNSGDPKTIMSSAPIPTKGKDKDHFAKAGEFLHRLYERDQLTDVVVHCGNTTFTAHATVLACHSPFFARALLHNKTCTHDGNHVSLTADVSPSAFHVLLDYMYTGELQINSESVAELLSASLTLDMVQVEKQCSDVLHTLTPEAVLVVWEMAERNTLQDVAKKALELIGRDFLSVINTSAFLDLDLQFVIQLLSNDDLPVASETEVADAGIRWLLHRKLQRFSFSSAVIGCVRLGLLSSKELFEIMDKADFIFKDEAVRTMFLEANWMATSKVLGIHSGINNKSFAVRRGTKALKRVNQEVELPKPKVDFPSNPNQVLFVDPTLEFEEIESSSSDDASGSLAYNMAGDLHPSCPSVRVTRLLLLGGYDPMLEEQTPTADKALTYNRAAHTWMAHGNLPVPCVHHTAVVFKDTVYIIGGSDPSHRSKGGLQPRNIVFAHSLSDSSWRQVASLNVARTRHGACLLGGKIYAVGGRNEKGVLSSVEVYDPSEDKWESVSDLNCPRLGAGVSSHYDYIMVAGGYGQAKPAEEYRILSTVECYDTKTDSWTFATNLRVPRCHGCLVDVGGRLFLCGGLSCVEGEDGMNNATSLSAIDVYREDTDDWAFHTDLSLPRHQVASAVLDGKLYVVGGVSSVTKKAMATMECYDIISATWERDVKELPHPLVGAELVTATLLF